MNLWEHLFGTFACSVKVLSSSNGNRKNSPKDHLLSHCVFSQSVKVYNRQKNRANISQISGYVTPSKLGCNHKIDPLKKTSWGIETEIIQCCFNKINHISRWKFHFYQKVELKYQVTNRCSELVKKGLEDKNIFTKNISNQLTTHSLKMSR